jgi:predicted acyl esterase
VAWSPYGKEGGAGTQVLDMLPARTGVPLSKLSEYQKWEGPDPAFWVNNGYAVVNVDARGAYKSEGNICMWGTQEGRDGSDFIDWVGQQTWCSGKVTLSGNSWLAACQWFIAAERPKHLTCIAPWEGFADIYGEFLARGGVVDAKVLNFFIPVISANAGEHTWENGVAMALDHPYGPYHEDHVARVENINVPAYVTASYSNQVHTMSTFSAYARLNASKWLRIHDTWEWPDYYDNQEDLLRFYDYHMKGVQNGWEQTPRVRAKIIETAQLFPAGTDVTSSAFPLPETDYRKLYLTQHGGFSSDLQNAGALTSPLTDGDLEFVHEFTEPCTLCGPVEGTFVISLKGADDADLYFCMEKVLASGAVGAQLKLPLSEKTLSSLKDAAGGNEGAIDAFLYKGPWGYNRVSRRQLRQDRAQVGIHTARLDVYEPVGDGQLVTLCPGFNPIGMVFDKGEKLRLRVSGTNPIAFPAIPGKFTIDNVPELNKTGSFAVHTGKTEESGSHVVLPFMRR